MKSLFPLLKLRKAMKRFHGSSVLSLLLAIAVTTLAAATIFSNPVFSDEAGDIEKEIEQTKEELDSKETVLSETEKKVNEILNSSWSVTQKIKAIEDEIAKAEKQIKENTQIIKDKEKLIRENDKEITEKLNIIKNLTGELYKNSRYSVLELLFSKTDREDLVSSYVYRKYSILNQTGSMEELSKELSDLEKERESLSKEKNKLESEKKGLDESKVILANEQARIQQEYAAQAAAQAALKAEIASLNSKLSSLSQELQSTISAKAGSGGDTSGGGNTPGGSSPQDPSSGIGKYIIYVDGSNKGTFNGPIALNSTDSNNVFKVNGTLYYRGKLEFRADSNVYMINELPFEKYLYGIGEVPSSWPSESLKAQVVAARTYAAKNWNKRTSYNYNLRDDTYDQNYVGYSKEVESYGDKWVSAVNNTVNKTIKSGSSLISAYYHSTCGGHTLASAEVWGGTLGYAQAESDWYQSGGSLVSYDAASPWSYKRWGSASINDSQMLDLLNASLYLAEDPNSPTRQNNIRRADLGGWTPGQIEDALGVGNRVQDQIGAVQNVQSVYNNGSTSIGSSSRLTSSIKVTGSSGTLTVDADIYWIVFNARSPGDLTIYWSNFWTIKKEAGSWNNYSRGYPHRVGMCQYGAYGRALAGQSYSQILGHYYNGTTIGNYSPPSNFRVGITRVTNGDIQASSNNGNTTDIYSNGSKVLSVSPGKSIRVVKQ